MAGDNYVKRGTKADAHDEAADATDYYADKFLDDFSTRPAPASARSGDKASDAADKISEWLRQLEDRRQRPGEEVALRDVAVQVAQGVGLRGVLDALGDAFTRRGGERDDGAEIARSSAASVMPSTNDLSILITSTGSRYLRWDSEA